MRVLVGRVIALERNSTLYGMGLEGKMYLLPRDERS